MKPLMLITGPVTTRSGYGSHTRDLVRSLMSMDKFDIHINSLRWGNTPMNALDANNPDDKTTDTPPAKPSKPSVKFTAFEEPTITKTEKGTKNQPRLIAKFLKNGKYKFLNSSYSTNQVKKIKPIMPISGIWFLSNLILRAFDAI